MKVFCVGVSGIFSMCLYTSRRSFNDSNERQYQKKRGRRGSKHSLPIPTWTTQKRVSNISPRGINSRNLTVVGKHQEKVTSEDKLKVGYINARSVNNKAEWIAEWIIDEGIDVCAITETWITSSNENNVTLGNLTPAGYKLTHVPRKGKKRGGGVAIICKASIKTEMQKHEDSFETFEMMEILMSSSKKCVRLAVIYRPPSG